MTKPERKASLVRRNETIQSLMIEIHAYESAIADAEGFGRGKLPHVNLLRQTLEEMKDRLQRLKHGDKE
jgi:hypothetical protein